MKKFWKIVLIPGLCSIVAGLVLAGILVLGFSEELMEHRDEFSINEENFFDYFEVEEYSSTTRSGRRYTEADAKESYQFAVPEGESITGINFEFAVGEVNITTGDRMEVTVVDMFENTITSKVKNGVWCIEDSLIDSGSVPSDYSPEITITIPAGTEFETIDIYLAAGVLEAKKLEAEEVSLEVSAGNMQIWKLEAKQSLELKNGVGEIKVYDADAKNLTVDNGIGAISLTGAISGNNSIDCGIGEVKLVLTDRSSIDFNYSVDCGIGEVEIDGSRFTGSTSNTSFDRSGADYFELDCGIGRIEIELGGN